ncbi:MAG TPA: hypothetical protein VF116_02275 [Ktedonobacterales bacterium]
MAHHVSVTLSDEEYAALAAEAAKNDTTVEAVAHQRVTQRHADGQGLRSQEIQDDLWCLWR